MWPWTEPCVLVLLDGYMGQGASGAATLRQPNYRQDKNEDYERPTGMEEAAKSLEPSTPKRGHSPTPIPSRSFQASSAPPSAAARRGEGENSLSCKRQGETGGAARAIRMLALALVWALRSYLLNYAQGPADTHTWAWGGEKNAITDEAAHSLAPDPYPP